MGCKEILSWSFLAKILPAKKFSKTETDRFITETLKEKKHSGKKLTGCKNPQ